VFSAAAEVQTTAGLFLRQSTTSNAGVVELLHDLNEFLEQYEAALQFQRPSNSLLLVTAADRLAHSLATTRDVLSLVRDALANAIPPESLPEAERFSLILFTSESFSEFVAKLTSIQRIYSELCDVLGAPEHAESASIAKIESGSMWVDILGLPRVVKLMASLVERAVEYIHRNYTLEGKITELPRKIDAVDAVLNLRSRLKAQGIDVAATDDILARATVKIASELNTLLSGEARVEVNRRQYSVGLAVEQRFVAESRVLQIEGGSTNAEPGPSDAESVAGT
jgi:hypothetical protein